MITLSPTNDKIKYIKKLEKRSFREKSGEFIIEGKRSVMDAIENGAEISYVICREDTDAVFPDGIKVFATDKKTFAEITDTESPQDMLAVAKAKCSTLSEIFEKAPSLIIYLDRLQDPGNLGTIIRTADARGDAAVVLSAGCVDLFNSKVIRSTMSSVFNISIVKDAVTEEIFPLFKKAGYKTVAGALSDKSTDLYETDLSGKCVIVVGNEGNGVCDYILENADILTIIPMRGKAESLNAGISAGIMMYEHLRQGR